MSGIFLILHNGLPVGPSQTLPSGRPSRGWTLRPDRVNPSAVRFDWLHGSGDATLAPSDAAERDELRRDVLNAVRTLAANNGLRVRVEGTGLVLSRRQPSLNQSSLNQP
jgi:hypothetical protein